VEGAEKTIYSQLVLLPVQNDCSDLLVHDHEQHVEQGGWDAGQGQPPLLHLHRVDDPVAVERGLPVHKFHA